MDDDELPEDLEAIGHHYTQWDCPLCGVCNAEEGDAKSKPCICCECGAEVLIR